MGEHHTIIRFRHVPYIARTVAGDITRVGIRGKAIKRPPLIGRLLTAVGTGNGREIRGDEPFTYRQIIRVKYRPGRFATALAGALAVSIVGKEVQGTALGIRQIIAEGAVGGQLNVAPVGSSVSGLSGSMDAGSSSSEQAVKNSR